MSVPIIAFFNNKSGVGKTSLVWHLAWVLDDMGKRVIAADLDPQADLTSLLVDDYRLEELCPENDVSKTVYGSLTPLLNATGAAAAKPYVETIDYSIGLLVGDLGLSGTEDAFTEAWAKCLDRDERAFRVTSAFWRIMQAAAQEHEADYVLIDLGSNLGAINRAALIASDYVVVPLRPDVYSLEALGILGPKLRQWRAGWQERLARNPIPDLEMPPGSIEPLGYVITQHSVRLDLPVKSYGRWISRIPSTYRVSVLGEDPREFTNGERDPYCLSVLKHYRSLMSMAQESKKPMFHLRAADGAMGAHQTAALDAGKEFRYLAERILDGIAVSRSTATVTTESELF